MNWRMVLLVLAIVCFVLAGVDADVVDNLDEGWLGLAFFAGAHL